MTPPTDPDHKFGQFIGAWFHQDAFDDHAETVDDIVDEFLRESSSRFVGAAAEGGRLLLDAGLDDEALATRLGAMGLWLLPEPAGFASYTALAEHLVKRLEQAAAADEHPAA